MIIRRVFHRKYFENLWNLRWVVSANVSEDSFNVRDFVLGFLGFANFERVDDKKTIGENTYNKDIYMEKSTV